MKTFLGHDRMVTNLQEVIFPLEGLYPEVQLRAVAEGIRGCHGSLEETARPNPVSDKEWDNALALFMMVVQRLRNRLPKSS